MIALIIAAAFILNVTLNALDVPQMLSRAVTSIGVTPTSFILMLLVFYIILGMFLEVLSMQVTTIPIVYPIAMALGIDPIWFGVFIVLMSEIALITPPVGMNLYVVQGMRTDGGPIGDVISGIWPYVIILILFTLLIWFVPRNRDLATREDVLTMNNTPKLWQRPATALAAGFRSGGPDPLEVLDAVLARREAVDSTLNAICTLDADGARKAAEASAARWRAGTPLSSIDGVPITIKDNIPVAGMRSTWGSLLYADHVPARDELPVARLRAAGAVILGKTNVPEFTLQGYTDNRVFGLTRNPWNPALTPGGSSGGAVAAVAAGIGPVAVGTDGGGSIRRPASHVGLVGLKPGIGRVAAHRWLSRRAARFRSDRSDRALRRRPDRLHESHHGSQPPRPTVGAVRGPALCRALAGEHRANLLRAALRRLPCRPLDSRLGCRGSASPGRTRSRG